MINMEFKLLENKKQKIVLKQLIKNLGIMYIMKK